MNAQASTSTPRMSPALARLIDEIRAIVRRDAGPAETSQSVANVLQPYLGDPDFLTAEQMQPDEWEYCRRLLHVEPERRFFMLALVWLPGQETAVHDHVSWCVVGVHRGEEDET